MKNKYLAHTAIIVGTIILSPAIAFSILLAFIAAGLVVAIIAPILFAYVLISSINGNTQRYPWITSSDQEKN